MLWHFLLELDWYVLSLCCLCWLNGASAAYLCAAWLKPSLGAEHSERDRRRLY